jgi:uncharacterized protein YdaL
MRRQHIVLRWFVVALLAIAAVTVAVQSFDDRPAEAAPRRTLLLYDNTGPFAPTAEEQATSAANLLSRFGPWDARPVGQYTSGLLDGYTGLMYVGSLYDEPLPSAFMDDVLATSKPVLWIQSNIWQLAMYQFTSTGTYWANSRGWEWLGYDFGSFDEVIYKDTSFTRNPLSGAIMGLTIMDPAKAEVLGEARRSDGTLLPWAVKSGNFTYVTDMPFAYANESDRYIAFADVLYEVFAPQVRERHRAIVRIEDVSADTDPDELRVIADALSAEGVPFAFLVIPEYRDPDGVYNNGTRQIIPISQQPDVLDAIKYMISKGGTPVMHGYTHQFDGLDNPYNSVSGDDFEFYRAFVDDQNFVRYSGPVPGDSQAWARQRLDAGLAELQRAGLPRPLVFTTPHYAASLPDLAAMRERFPARLERGSYFYGALSGRLPDYARLTGQFFPYPVRDVYGSVMLPENLGNEELEEFNNNPPRLPAQIIDNARKNLVVRDGFASFFWHPYLVSDRRAGVDDLREIVQGIKALGYTFIDPASLAYVPVTDGI